MKFNLITILTFLFIGCAKDDNNFNGYGYPNGIKIIDKESINDCTLPECSENRIVRLIAKNVKGTIHLDSISNSFGIGYRYTFDSYIDFYLCDLPSEFQINGLQVVFDGKLLDACGYRRTVWPIEEVYTLQLDKIELQ